MDFAPYLEILKSVMVACLPLLLAFVAEIARRIWLEFRNSNKFQELNWIERKIATIVADSVATTYARSIRPIKAKLEEQGKPIKLTPVQKINAENDAILEIEKAASAANIPLPSDSILRGKVVNAVNEAKSKAAIRKAPTTKGM